jgi:hypothetical protein
MTLLLGERLELGLLFVPPEKLQFRRQADSLPVSVAVAGKVIGCPGLRRVLPSEGRGGRD